MFNDLTFERSSELAEFLWLNSQQEKDKVVIIYNKFINAASQEIVTEQFLPIVPAELMKILLPEIIYEPSEIVDDLIPKSLKTQLFKGLLDSRFRAQHV